MRDPGTARNLPPSKSQANSPEYLPYDSLLLNILSGRPLSLGRNFLKTRIFAEDDQKSW
jgi:hypothetical protein